MVLTRQHSIALRLMSALLPTFGVSHGDVAPCSDPQRANNLENVKLLRRNMAANALFAHLGKGDL